ncbi:MAG TPA: hypothetical protein VK213_05925 [Bacteroidales bacterium]|nr:hypothetical protein [Bacteroidales bacterium]
MRRVILIIIIVFWSFKGFSQKSMSSMYADSITYNLYLRQQWVELTDKAEEAIKSGFDYYYMRMRLAIAYYERHNYARASENFIRALEFSADDQLALEYLFYSYYLSGKYFLAWTVVPRLSIPNRERIVKESRIKRNSVTAETSYLNADAGEIIASRGQVFRNPEAGSQAVTKYFINNAVYLSHIIGKRSSYFHAFTNLVKENILHYFDGNLSADMYGQKVVQNQYYGRMNFFTPTGLVISPSFHFLSTGYDFPAYTSSGTGFSGEFYTARSNGFACGLGITKTSGYLVYAGEAIFSNLNNIKQLQGTLGLFFYPAGNQNIYLGGKVSMLNNADNSAFDPRFVASLTAGFSVNNRIFFEFSGTTGKMKNYCENNGLVVFNGVDFPTGSYSGRISVPFYRLRLTVFAGAGFGTYSSEFVPSDGYSNSDANKLNYNNYKVTGGLSWNF